MARRRLSARKKPPVEFTDAPDVQAMAVTLIGLYHEHLCEAKIKYLFRSGTWNKLKRETWGTAEKVGPKWKHLSGFDFVITINKDIWDSNFSPNRAAVEALLDHELQHCCKTVNDKTGEPLFYIQGHDVEDFVSIIRRNGLWSNALMQMHRAGAEYQQAQLVFEKKLQAVGS